MQVKPFHGLKAGFAALPLLAVPDRGFGAIRIKPVVCARLCKQHRVLQPQLAAVDQSTPGLHGVGFRVGAERPDRYCVSWQRKQFPGVRSGIRARPAQRVQR